MNNILIKSFILMLMLSMAGCKSFAEKLSNVGKRPKFSSVRVYDDGQEEKELKFTQDTNTSKTSNTLWTPNSRTFFLEIDKLNLLEIS